jgi:hypothetical protein
VDAVKGTNKVAGRGVAVNTPNSGAPSADFGRGRGIPPSNGPISAATRKPDFSTAGRGRGKESPSSGPRSSANGFSEEMYTTKVPELSEEKRREAERIAAEIEEESKLKQGRVVREVGRGGAAGNFGRRTGGPERSAAGEYEDDDYADADAAGFISEDAAAGPAAFAQPTAQAGPIHGDPHLLHAAASAGLPPPGAYGGAATGGSTLPASLLNAAAAAQAQARAAAAAAAASATADKADKGEAMAGIDGSDADDIVDEDDDAGGSASLPTPPATSSLAAEAGGVAASGEGLLGPESAAAFLGQPECLALLRFVSHEYQVEIEREREREEYQLHLSVRARETVVACAPSACKADLARARMHARFGTCAADGLFSPAPFPRPASISGRKRKAVGVEIGSVSSPRGALATIFGFTRSYGFRQISRQHARCSC